MRRIGLSIVLWCVAGAPAAAQTRQPLPAVVVDVRGFYSGLGQDPITAGDLSVDSSDLPNRGLCTTIGLQLYPLRGRTVSLGVGGELIVARASHVPEPDDDEDDGTALPQPTINQRLRGLSANVSLNFGGRDGWSYVTAGVGPTTFSTYEGDETGGAAPPRKSTINFGAGARWFAWRHFAFTADIRFYQTGPEVAVGPYAARGRATLRVLSAGISIR